MSPLTGSAAIDPQRRQIQLAHGRLDWLELGPIDTTAGTELAPLVLLHGIGSCAASWQDVMPLLAHQRRVLAWDAPGYASSAPLPMSQPQAADYALAAGAWMAAAQVRSPIVIGHSLGALIAAAFVAASAAETATATATATAANSQSRHPVSGLILVSPAQGYGAAVPAVREAKFNERVAALRNLGTAGMAAQRSARLCAPGASAAVLARVQDNMLQITEQGYAQAAWMLAHGDIHGHLTQAQAQGLTQTSPLGLNLAVLCGELDLVTPPLPSRALAQRYAAAFHGLPGVGHACYVEDPHRFAATLLAAIAALGDAPPQPSHA